MADPYVSLFEIISSHLARTNKIEWRRLQAEINARVKANKGVDPKTAKQKVFAELSGHISNALNRTLLVFVNHLQDEIQTTFISADVGGIASEIMANNPELAEIVKNFISDTLGGLDHGLNEKQYKLCDEIGSLISSSVRMGKNIGRDETKAELEKALGPFLPSRY